MKICAALKQAAIAAGLNGTQIAAAVGVHESTVSRWLSGETEPRSQQLLALIDAIPGFGKLLRSVAA